MILNYLTQCGQKKFFRSMICIMILSFTITTCGCYTTHKDMIPPESLGKAVTYHILKAVMNDGRVIDFKGNQVAFVKKYQNYTNVILYESAETTWVSAGVYNVSSTNLKVIEIKDVQSLLVEKEEIPRYQFLQIYYSRLQ